MLAGQSYRVPNTLRRHVIQPRALVLIPAGSGSTEHLDEDVAKPTEIKLVDGQFELGRSDTAQINIPYPTVSSRHAILRVAGDALSVTDLKSTNGTAIDGDDLTPMEAVNMVVGQTVVFGDSFLAQYKLEKQTN